MPLTIGDLRRAIAGRPDEEEVGLCIHFEDFEDSTIGVDLSMVRQRATGQPEIEVVIYDLDDDDEDWDDDDADESEDV